MGGVGGRGPKDDHVLMPRTCECVTLPGKGDFADATELRILRRRILPDHSGGPV